MSEAAPRPETNADDEAAFDDWLAASDTALHEKVATALDLDTGRAHIFAASLTAETASTVDAEEPEEWAHLEAVLREAADSIAHWLALSAPHTLSQQLSKALSTTRTMVVVGRALLPDSLSAPWGLAADFLTESHLHLTQLRGGILHRTLDRQEALGLHTGARSGIATFQAALEHTLQTTAPGSKAHLVMNRLLSTGEMLLLLLRWTRESIDHLFDDMDRHSQVPSANHR
ncbi:MULTISPECIES: hypothetical protein [Streptomyces]|uniref:hypothetical protein n=1 Tax=Streptomyces TaxID=1883 RepID=UPI00292DA144|nr:hypothetical protein [Streptomyces sp. NEAU-HV9]